MEISGSCSIQLSGDNHLPIDQKTLKKIQGELTEALSTTLDELMTSYGFFNQQVNSCLVYDLDIEE